MAAQLDLFGNLIEQAPVSKSVKKQKTTILQKPQQIYTEEVATKEDNLLAVTGVDIAVDLKQIDTNQHTAIEEVVATPILTTANTNELVTNTTAEENQETIDEATVINYTEVITEKITTEEARKEEVVFVENIATVNTLIEENEALLVEQPYENIENKNSAETPILEFSLEEPEEEYLPTVQQPIAVSATNQPPKEKLEKRGRKSYKEIEATADLINIPSYDILEQKLYYGIGEVATWFNVNSSQIRFWENEFDILKPRKTKKGDRLFRVEDIKNLELIHHLLRVKKLSIQGAKDYLKAHKKNANVQFALSQSLNNFKSFLLALKANL